MVNFIKFQVTMSIKTVKNIYFLKINIVSNIFKINNTYI